MDSSSLNSLLTSSPSERAVAELAEALLSSETGRKAATRAYSRINYERHREYRIKWQAKYDKQRKEKK